MERLAILGASYLQLPLILKAKELGYETHVFAWRADDVGEYAADVFHPISVADHDLIARECRDLGVVGVCTVATDFGAVAANAVAHELGLPCNPPLASLRASNKHEMRLAFERGGDPSPRSLVADAGTDLASLARELRFPIIVKPTDRSGSRAITRLEDPAGLADAVARALESSFEHRAVVEEYAVGTEYSVECATQGGVHHLLAVTRKFTTGDPHYIETGHLEPAPLAEGVVDGIRSVVFHALDSLGIVNSISHSELKIRPDGSFAIIEIGGRMGGDCIGTDLVPLTTGVDFVKCAIDLAVGKPLDLTPTLPAHGCALVRFIMDADDLAVLRRLEGENPGLIVQKTVDESLEGEVTDSGSRHGCFILAADSVEELAPYFPAEENHGVL